MDAGRLGGQIGEKGVEAVVELLHAFFQELLGDFIGIDAESRERIRTLVSESPDSRFLAIGYASTDGSQDRNRELSSRRALATAEAIAEARPNHPVEAVYFGQTQRFDLNRRAANRVVEIWKID